MVERRSCNREASWVRSSRRSIAAQWRLGLAVTALRTSTKLSSGPVSTGMGDHVRVLFMVRDIYLGM